jgi:hypothetical protein
MYIDSSGGVIMKRLLAFAFLFVLMTVAVNALTASMGNARMIIHTEVEQGTPTVIQKSIKVNNVNDVAVEVSLMPSGDIMDFTEILDNNIVLAPGQSRDARFVMSLEYGGRYEGKVLVSFSPADDNVTSQPVGLASTIIILAEGPENPNPPSSEQEEPEQPEETEEPEEPEEQEQPEETEPEEATEDNQPEGTASESKSNPLIGMTIILVVLALGAGAYFVLMRK